MITQSVWNLITNVGDSAVAVPLAALVLVVLYASGWSRAALGWLAAVAFCASAMIVFKLAFKVALEGCGMAAAGAPHFSPSGHAALGALVYGGLAVLGSRHLPQLARLLLAMAASAWVCTIAASRLALHVHSPLEVAVGLAVGGASVALLAWSIGRSAGPRWLVPALGVVTVAVFAAMYGTRWPAEQMLHRAAVWVRGAAGFCG